MSKRLLTKKSYEMSQVICLVVSLLQKSPHPYPRFSLLDIAAAETVCQSTPSVTSLTLRLDKIDLEFVLPSNGSQSSSDEESARGTGSSHWQRATPGFH